MPGPKLNQFLSKHAEKGELNQYWYSPNTIETVCKEVQAVASRVAFMSTPSLYFSLPKGCVVRKQSSVFDFDSQSWASEPNFVFYDYNKPGQVPEHLLGSFDCVVIDPPFVTEEVWRNYATTAKMLLSPGGKVILSTIAENKDMLFNLFEVVPQVFKPSIPNLIYQYMLFTNYTSVHLNTANPELPEED